MSEHEISVLEVRIMIRKIVQIDKDKCNGCGACAEACHEGAIGMVDGKAQLLRDDYCDGLGDCLPACPTGAITFVEREAAEYDRAAVLKNMTKKSGNGCPGSQAKRIAKSDMPADVHVPSRLSQWPVQIKLVPAAATYFDGADLLIAADCTAYAYGNFHEDFIRGRKTLVGCPKLDSVNYAEKLSQIFSTHDIKSITVARMEVPCCGGLEYAVKMALQACGKDIPCNVVTISTDGQIL